MDRRSGINTALKSQKNTFPGRRSQGHDDDGKRWGGGQTKDLAYAATAHDASVHDLPCRSADCQSGLIEIGRSIHCQGCFFIRALGDLQNYLHPPIGFT